MSEITSLNNEIVKSASKLLQKKYRDESGLFLLEGEKAVAEAVKGGIKLKDIFINKKNSKLFEKYERYNPSLVNDKILEKITDAKSAPDIAATAFKFENDLSLISNKNSAVLLLENIKDAGNLGTAIRTACAFDVDGIILLGETVDLFSPKVVRSAVGYLWKKPIFKTNDINLVKNYFKNHKFFATSVDATLPLKKLQEAEIKAPCVIMFGSEADGLTSNALQKADVCVTIPIDGDVESLNLSISIGIVLYEFKR